jgi:hypothetical protein
MSAVTDNIFTFKTAVLHGHPLSRIHVKKYKEVIGESI